MMFEGKLQPLPFELINARSYLGAIKSQRKRKSNRTWHYFDFKFVISTSIDLPEKMMEDTIIHEMIHYWILSNQMQDNSPHGDLFKAKMKEINERFGRNVKVAHKRTLTDESKDVEIRQHLICITQLSGNRLGITIACKTQLFMLWDRLPRIPDVKECQWYSSCDPFFNRYPRTRSLKIYKITHEDLEAHRKDFKPLAREGDIIKIVDK